MLEALVDTPGLDANRADNEGNSPLHFAAQAGEIASFDGKNAWLVKIIDLFPFTVIYKSKLVILIQW